MYLKIVNIDIITKTKNVFKSIELLADYRYTFCTHWNNYASNSLEHCDINTNVLRVNSRNLSFGRVKTQSKFWNNLF